MTGTAQAAPATTQRHRTWWRETIRSVPRDVASRLRPPPVHPAFVAVYPVLFLYAGNLAEVSPGETIAPMLRAIVVVATITLVTGLFLRDLRRGALIGSALGALWFGWHWLLQPMVTAGLTVPIGGMVIFGLAAATIGGAIALRAPAIARATSVANLVTGLLVAVLLAGLLPHYLARAVGGPVPLESRLAAAPDARDIWFLVFDRYGNHEAMLDAAGIENDLPSWLETRGFRVAHDARANYGRTTLSLAATLNMTYLDELTARLGPDSGDAVPVADLLQDHAVGRFLEEHGYRYVHIGNWFGPTKTNAIADENPVLTTPTDFENILERTSFEPFVAQVLGAGEPNHHLLHFAAGRFSWEQLQRVSSEPGPKFVFGHVLLPHEPYVFKANGEYAGLDTYEAKFSKAAHREQLAFTNDRIRDLVTTLLSVPPEQQPIIILSADEGPYPDRYAEDQGAFDWGTATDAELVTKYGVLMAMFLPGDAPAGAPDAYEDMSLINTFPIVLDRYFDQDIPLLPDRSYTSRSWGRPYDVVDVTDRLHEIMP